MHISNAIRRDDHLFVEADGRKLRLWRTKSTILELGYAIYDFVGERDVEWLRENNEIIPADPADGRSAVEIDDSLLTSNSVLVLLASDHWWANNGRPQPENTPLPIPAYAEAKRKVDAIIRASRRRYAKLRRGVL